MGRVYSRFPHGPRRPRQGRATERPRRNQKSKSASLKQNFTFPAFRSPTNASRVGVFFGDTKRAFAFVAEESWGGLPAVVLPHCEKA